MYMYYRVDATRVSPEQLAKFMGREAIVEVSRFPGARILVVGVRAP
jgi:hypothetical protein